MLISKTIKVKWAYKTRKWYESKGYVFTNWNDEFEVKINDLNNNSCNMVQVLCDNQDCLNPIFKLVRWTDYLKCVKEDGKYYCQKCAIKLYGHNNSIKAHLKNGKSFYDWCYENLTKEEADKLMLRWDYEKNVDKDGNVITPKDITYSSVGVDRNGYWFKCLEHPEHESEQRNISSFTSNVIRQKRSIECRQCNTIKTTNPELIKYLVNNEDANIFSLYSNKKLLMKCPRCNYIKLFRVANLSLQGFACPKCGDGISYSEKFIYNLLDQLNVKFECQVNKTLFEWCSKYKYDFYIYNICGFLEVHGIQHYEETLFTGSKHIVSLEEVQENDKIKEQLAKQNGIKYYIVLDCRKSELEWIKNSIIQSELPTLLNFKEEDIDWLKCHEYACNSLVKVVCDLWNEGFNNTLKLAEHMKMGRSTITRYLKRGAKLMWCNYNSLEESEKGLITMNKNRKRKIICLTTDETFESLIDACNKYNIKSSNLTMCCQGKQKTSGKHPITGEPLKWKYFNE